MLGPPESRPLWITQKQIWESTNEYPRPKSAKVVLGALRIYRPDTGKFTNSLAEGAGFEPAVRLSRTHAFQACALSRSATPPSRRPRWPGSSQNSIAPPESKPAPKAPPVTPTARAIDRA